MTNQVPKLQLVNLGLLANAVEVLATPRVIEGPNSWKVVFTTYYSTHGEIANSKFV